MSDVADLAGRKAAVFSAGLWRIRKDLSRLLDMTIVLPLPGSQFDAAIGWGRRPSYYRARRRAAHDSIPVMAFEDGFLAGYSPSLREPNHSYIVDHSGIYYETSAANDLDRLINTQRLSIDDESIAVETMLRLATNEITKFNCWQDCRAGINVASEPFILVVDQVPKDASIAGAGADNNRFATMLKHAAEHANGRKILINTLPANIALSPLLKAAVNEKIAFSITPAVNPWHLIKEADAVWTISSPLGFEALMAGKPVHAFGRSFYAGRGLTVDYFPEGKQAECSLPHLFHTFYEHYMRNLDLHTRKPISFSKALDQAITVRKQRERNTVPFFTGGLSPWKRTAIDPFLICAAGKPRHKLTASGALKAAQRENGVVAIWGDRQNSIEHSTSIEDGFIRSRGLGANLVYPSSIVLDAEGLHFDHKQASDLENILQTYDFSDTDRDRARHLRTLLIATGVTKYNIKSKLDLPVVPSEKMKIFVPGQVETDASILLGSPHVKTNESLVAAVRKMYPDAFIAYKVHPDSAAGLRAIGSVPCHQDYTAVDGSAHDWICWADRVETITSLTGFEALLRGKPVGTHGVPGFAGWGLTDDRVTIPRRSRRLLLDELVFGYLIAYPYYVHPISRIPCEPEELVEILADTHQNLDKKTNVVANGLNRLAIKIRDYRRSKNV